MHKMLRKGVFSFAEKKILTYRAAINVTSGDNLGLGLLPHSTYSPGLATSTFFLFPGRKEKLKGTRLQDEADFLFERKCEIQWLLFTKTF